MSYRDTAIKILKQMGTTDSEAKLIEKKLYIHDVFSVPKICSLIISLVPSIVKYNSIFNKTFG